MRYFTEIIGGGGILLLDIGPKADGTIPAEQAERLRGLGAWIGRHEEAVYGTKAGLPPGHFYGASTLSEDACTLYLMFYDCPTDQISVRGLINKVKRISLLNDGRELSHQKLGGAIYAEIPGVLWIDVPADCIDTEATVVALELDGPLRLYRGKGKVVSQN